MNYILDKNAISQAKFLPLKLKHRSANREPWVRDQERKNLGRA
jgi:hypothetical protein